MRPSQLVMDPLSSVVPVAVPMPSHQIDALHSAFEFEHCAFAIDDIVTLVGMVESPQNNGKIGVVTNVGSEEVVVKLEGVGDVRIMPQNLQKVPQITRSRTDGEHDSVTHPHAVACLGTVRQNPNFSTTGSGTQESLITSPAAASPAAMAQTSAAHAVAASEADVATAQAASLEPSETGTSVVCVCVCVCARARARVCMYVCMHACICVSVYVFM